MADLKFKPVRHDHKQFLEQASQRRGFTEAYEALDVEYALAHEMLAAWALPRAQFLAWSLPGSMLPLWHH